MACGSQNVFNLIIYVIMTLKTFVQKYIVGITLHFFLIFVMKCLAMVITTDDMTIIVLICVTWTTFI